MRAPVGQQYDASAGVGVVMQYDASAGQTEGQMPAYPSYRGGRRKYCILALQPAAVLLPAMQSLQCGRSTAARDRSSSYNTRGRGSNVVSRIDSAVANKLNC